MTKNDDLILSTLMDVKGEIGELKGLQANMQTQITDLDKSMEAMELTYNAPAFQIPKGQIGACVGAIILTICGVGVVV